MGTTNVSQAAQIASEQSGIPASVLVPLIQLEGPTNSAPNNPFDITNVWANIWGGSGYVLPTLWNILGIDASGKPYGVAQFTNQTAAIQSWANGILKDGNYSGVRAVLATPGASVQDFYNALAKTGYAGGDPFYGTNLGNRFKQTTGMDPTTTSVSSGQVTVSPPVTAQPPATTTTTTTTTTLPTVTTAPPSTVPVVGPLIDSVNYLGASVQADVLSLERFFWIVIGLIIAIVGLWLLVQQESNEVAA